MNPNESSSDEPAAYDTEGQSLYSQPQEKHSQDEPTDIKPVRIVRPNDPAKLPISEEIKLRHERSKQAYPELNISDNEYIVVDIKRHMIGLLVPSLLGLTLIIASIIVLFDSSHRVSRLVESSGFAVGSTNNILVLPVVVFILLVLLGMCAVYYIFKSNKFFLTNESVIQEIQTTLFSKREQTISLSNIEDASYTQTNILQYMFNYGSIRLSTVGDENTYRLTYVLNPSQQIDVLNDAVEAFKNGRPIEG